MRALPEMKVFTPADGNEATWAVLEAYKRKGPAYIRLGRGVETRAITCKGRTQIDQGIVWSQGEDIAILASGVVLSQARLAAEMLKKSGYSIRLISFPQVKPLGETLVTRALEQCSWVFTVEEHSLVGGFSAAVFELARAKGLRVDKLYPLSAPEITFHETGSHAYLRRRAGLDSQGIVKRIRDKVLC
jgi:transketolase